MTKSQNQSIIKFYVIANRLKTEIRAGFKTWDVSAPRLESVAEHIYGTQMLAIAFASEYKIDVDLRKVVMMLAVHELGETIVGDITPMDGVSKSKKHQMEVDAVQKVLSNLSNSGEIQDLFMEFERNETKEARFCRQIDKLEACLQALIYDKEGYTDFTRARTGQISEIQLGQIQQGYTTLGKAWTNKDIEWGIYDGEFLKFAKYIRDNKILEEK